MKKALKKAFTLVELLVVIAIIAVLSVAGIVGYSVFTKKAETSNDIAAVTQFDTLLQGMEALEGKPSSFSDAVELLKQEGIDLDNLKLASDKHALGFDPAEQTFVLLENGKVIFPEDYKGTPNNLYVFDTPDYILKDAANAYLSDVAAASEKIVPQMQEILQDGKAHYVSKDIATAMSYHSGPMPTAYTVKNSLDSPYLTRCKISYVDTEAEEVTFNLGNNEPERDADAPALFELPLKSTKRIIKDSTLLSELAIDNANATVNHYGYVDTVSIGNVKEYHCFAERWPDKGDASISISGSGKIIFEEGYVVDRTWDYSAYTPTNHVDTKTYPTATIIKILPSKDGSDQVRNIEIDLGEPLSAYYQYQRENKGYYNFKILIDGNAKNVNLKINSKGCIGNAQIMITTDPGKVPNSNMDNDTQNYMAFAKLSEAGTFEGYVDGSGNFYAGTRPAAASIASNVRNISFAAPLSQQQEEAVAVSTWENPDTGATVTRYFTAEEFAAASSVTTNPLWGGNCDPSGTFTRVTLLDNVTLRAGVAIGYLGMPDELNITFDMNGKTLTYAENTTAAYILRGEGTKVVNLIVTSSAEENGKIVNGQVQDNNSYGGFDIYDNCSIELHFVTFNGEGSEDSAVYVHGTSANVTITDSKITGDYYGIATNASAIKVDDEHGVTITVSSSDIISLTGTGIMMNVAGTVTVTGGNVCGYLQAIFMRGGSAILDNVDLYLTVNTTEYLTYFDNRTWGSGDTANIAVMTLGNKSTSANYQRPVTVSLTNCRLHTTLGYPAIFVWSNNTAGNGVTLTYNGTTYFDGNIILGGTPVAALGEDDYGLFNLSVNNTTYAGQQGPITIEPRPDPNPQPPQE